MHLNNRKRSRFSSFAPLLIIALFALLPASCMAASASKRQIAEWTGLLNSDNPQKRSSAATSLLAADSDVALSALLNALDPKQPRDVRVSVITAFGVTGDDRAVKQIVQAVGDQDQQVREAACAALLSINSPATLQALVEAARDDKRSGQTRIQIIGLLGDLRDMEAIPSLIALLSDKDDGVRKGARAALERITLRSFDTPQGWAEWWRHSSTLSRDEMLAELATRQSQKIAELTQRLETLQLLAIRDHPADAQLLIGIVTDSASVKTKLEAIKCLSQLRGTPVADALMGVLGDADPSVRLAACDALGAQGDARAVAPLMAALADDMVVVRAGAAKALGALKAKESIDPLCKLLGDPAPEAAAAAAWALGELADPAALDALVAAVSSDQTAPAVYEAGVHALAKIRDPRAIPALAKQLDSKNEKARWAAVDALGNLGAQEASGAICAIATKDPNPQIRKTALAALGKIGAPESLDSIVDSLSDADQSVADQALRSLVVLAGADAARYGRALDRLLAGKRFALAEKALLNGLEQTGRQANGAEAAAALNYRMASGLAANREWALARPYMEALLAKYPGDARYLSGLAECLGGQGDMDALLAMLAQARKNAPGQAALVWKETVKAVELINAAGDFAKVVAIVDSLEKEYRELGGAETAARLNDLRSQAKSRLPPPALPAPAPAPAPAAPSAPAAVPAPAPAAPQGGAPG